MPIRVGMRQRIRLLENALQYTIIGCLWVLRGVLAISTFVKPP